MLHKSGLLSSTDLESGLSALSSSSAPQGHMPMRSYPVDSERSLSLPPFMTTPAPHREKPEFGFPISDSRSVDGSRWKSSGTSAESVYDGMSSKKNVPQPDLVIKKMCLGSVDNIPGKCVSKNVVPILCWIYTLYRLALRFHWYYDCITIM